MSLHKPSKDEQDFVRVVKFSTALGLGLMVGFLYSIKQVHPNLRVEFTFGTVVAFLLTAIFSWIFCGVLFTGEFAGDGAAAAAAARKRRVRRWLILFLAISGLSTAGAFLYSLKDVSSESRREVIEGTGIAVLLLTIGGFLIHRSVRFFEEQDRASLEQQQREKNQDEEER